jgi:uncharacterized protein (TIGR03083 family)
MDVRELHPIDRDEMVGLATTEYERLLSMFRDLSHDDWARPTPCEGWSVRDIAGHLLGAAEANASVLENARQGARGFLRVRGTGRDLVDGINDVQIEDRRDLEPGELLDRLERIAPRAVQGRRRTPAPFRRVRVPAPGGPITLGYLVDVVYTRDQWMHRLDVADATGRQPSLTPEQDGRIVADLVRDWALAHGEPVTLELTGPAGGTYQQGTGGPHLQHDAVRFSLAISGRVPAEGLLGVHVVF